MCKRKRGFIPFSETKDQRILDAWCSDNEGTPADYHIGSHTKIKFICYTCNHPFSMTLGVINKGGWCMYCSGRNICGDTQCSPCNEKSFAYHHPEKALEWSKKNTRTPYEVMKSSNVKYWFDCATCGHEHYMSPEKFTAGRNCRYCSNNFICDTPGCIKCYQLSFAFLSPQRAKEWSDNNEKGPNMVSNWSSKEYLFNCEKCKHEYSTPLLRINDSSEGGCPYCSKKRLCPDSANCRSCFLKSFASFEPEKVACFSDKNPKTPSQYYISSSKKVIFDCDKCNKEFATRIYGITGQMIWCPHCQSYRNKNMSKLCKSLDGHDGIIYKPEVTVRCEGRPLRWDLVVTTAHGKIHIESDGPQHFTLKETIKIRRQKVEGAIERFTDQRTRDLLKEDHIRANNGLLFRFSYRQRDRIPEFVEMMLKEVAAGTKGVIYLDDLYDNWGPVADYETVISTDLLPGSS